MKPRRLRTSVYDQLRQAIEEIGGEPLIGSGFEDETPDPQFYAAELLVGPAVS